jgi:hypothetical protein
MSVEEAKKELIRAEKSLESANVLLSNGFYEDAISNQDLTPILLEQLRDYIRRDFLKI